jgi:hypothetical protein
MLDFIRNGILYFIHPRSINLRILAPKSGLIDKPVTQNGYVFITSSVIHGGHLLKLKMDRLFLQESSSTHA